ncbi:hypothetical protein VTN00DRAFT_3696 [Thermoascus crustaceus]|uniref:uncharacterized protein n=1 Tax=Thermoascus crustaceus TaxID=5088 RepID=UPI003743CCB6
MAVHLRDLANKALSKTFLMRLDQNSAVPRPLWEVQCKLLLIVGAAFGGDSAAVSTALEDIGFFHREYSLRRASLSPNAIGHECSTWAEWIDRESSQRLLYGIFIVSSLRRPVDSHHAGHLLVRKTAAFSWSIEHAIAAWNCALFYTKWVHTMEIQQHHSPPDPEEKENLDNIKALLREVDREHSENASLAAEVT